MKLSPKAKELIRGKDQLIGKPIHLYQHEGDKYPYVSGKITEIDAMGNIFLTDDEGRTHYINPNGVHNIKFK